MKNLADKLIKLAQAESSEAFPLKEPLVWNSKRFEAKRYSEYVPMCDPNRFYIKDKGYALNDGCSSEFFIDDKIKCSIFYDRLSMAGEGNIVESFEDALRFIRKIANAKFSEIWDDEDEQANIDMVIKMAEVIGNTIEEQNLLDK
ncbi:MAG: hypothetical protein RL154_1194 [Pseudomonadota bacterium]|jgi:hypothetical protein